MIHVALIVVVAVVLVLVVGALVVMRWSRREPPPPAPLESSRMEGGEPRLSLAVQAAIERRRNAREI